MRLGVRRDPLQPFDLLFSSRRFRYGEIGRGFGDCFAYNHGPERLRAFQDVFGDVPRHVQFDGAPDGSPGFQGVERAVQGPLRDRMGPSRRRESFQRAALRFHERLESLEIQRILCVDGLERPTERLLQELVVMLPDPLLRKLSGVREKDLIGHAISALLGLADVIQRLCLLHQCGNEHLLGAQTEILRFLVQSVQHRDALRARHATRDQRDRFLPFRDGHGILRQPAADLLGVILVHVAQVHGEVVPGIPIDVVRVRQTPFVLVFGPPLQHLAKCGLDPFGRKPKSLVAERMVAGRVQPIQVAHVHEKDVGTFIFSCDRELAAFVPFPCPCFQFGRDVATEAIALPCACRIMFASEKLDVLVSDVFPDLHFLERLLLAPRPYLFHIRVGLFLRAFQGFQHQCGFARTGVPFRRPGTRSLFCLSIHTANRIAHRKKAQTGFR